MSIKSTNVRQLMNLLSQKYFGNQPNYASNKPQTPIHKPYAKNEDNNLNVLSPVTSCKTSPKFNRLSSSQGKPMDSRGKSSQNFNYFEQTKNYFDQTRAKFKKPPETILRTNERKKLELRDTNGSYANTYVSGNQSGSEMEQSQSGIFVNSYSKKTSQKDLMKNSSGSYLNPVTFSAISVCQNIKTTNSRLVKQSITESKGNAKRLFLKENSSSVHKLESNSTISNSRGTEYARKESLEKQNMIKNRVEEQEQMNEQRLREKLQFYRSKCMNLEQENSELKEKVLTYEEQFAEQKLLVQNLKNMISKREQEIDQIIQKRLAGHQKKQKVLQSLRGENQTLRNELQEVKEVLKQQESIIMELYAQSKQKPVNKNEGSKEQRAKSVTKVSGQNIGSFGTKSTFQNIGNGQKMRMNSSNVSKHMGVGAQVYNSSNNERSYGFRYTSQNGRESITETSYEDDELRNVQ